MLFFVLFAIIVTISVDAICDSNTIDLEIITDIVYDINIPMKYSSTPTNRVVDASLTLLELEYYMTTDNYYELSAKNLNNLGIECDTFDANVACVLKKLSDQKLYPNYEYMKNDGKNNYNIFNFDYIAPIQITNISYYQNLNNQFSSTDNFIAYLIDYLHINPFITYAEFTILNENGYNEILTKPLTKINYLPIVVVGIYQDEFDDIYLKYNSLNGYNWGCDGYGYIRITDYATDEKIYYNARILETIIMVDIANMFVKQSLYTIDENTYNNIMAFTIFSICFYVLLGISLGVVAYLHMRKKIINQQSNQQTETNDIDGDSDDNYKQLDEKNNMDNYDQQNEKVEIYSE
jgi:hypothetical protein